MARGRWRLSEVTKDAGKFTGILTFSFDNRFLSSYGEGRKGDFQYAFWRFFIILRNFKGFIKYLLGFLPFRNVTYMKKNLSDTQLNGNYQITGHSYFSMTYIRCWKFKFN